MIQLVTAANKNHSELLAISTRRNQMVGYEPTIYALDDSVDGLKLEPPPEFKQYLKSQWWLTDGGKLPHKPYIILDALRRFGRDVVWMDADAFALGPLESVFDYGCDILATLRRPGEVGGTSDPMRWGYSNAGVVFVKHTPEAIEFMECWCHIMASVGSKSDQEGLNRLILSVNPPLEHGSEFMCHGARCKWLSTDEFNFYYFPEAPWSATKVVHFKTDKRAAGLKWLKEFERTPALA